LWLARRAARRRCARPPLGRGGTGMSTDFNKLRIGFMNRVLAPSVSGEAFKLAHLICYRYMNRESRTAFVSQETPAGDLGATVRTVQYRLDVLAPLGLSIERGNGRGRASSYRIDERRNLESAFEGEKAETDFTLSGAKGRNFPQERAKFSARKGETN